jgi:UPF0176 protein
MPVTVSAFYKFVRLEDPLALQPPLLEQCHLLAIKGSILLAREGINGTVSGTSGSIREFLDWLKSDPRFADVVSKESAAEDHPFQRLKVRLKQEIVALGQEDADPTARTGTYVSALDWNDLIEDPGVTVLDTRNAYEVRIGTFKGAIDPDTRAFRQFPEFVRTHLDPKHHPKIAMFCTGGIRCEKASSYLLSQGFAEVYQLEGGILKYLETIPPEESLWQGECFVFDERVALTHGVAAGTHSLCRGCGSPIPSGAEASSAAGTVACPSCFGQHPPA